MTNENNDNKQQYATIRVENQLFGIQVNNIEDILTPQKICPIPLSPPEVIGALNLRGRIVTAIDLKKFLGIQSKTANDSYRNVVVDYNKELYSLQVDSVSEVIHIANEEIAHNPENLSERWKEVSDGVYSMEKELMVILNVEKLLYIPETKEITEEEL